MHSVSVCQTPSRNVCQTPSAQPMAAQKKISVDLDIDRDSPVSQLSDFDSPTDQWVAALQTLELSLDEVVHIRSVLTRAELEALPLDNNVKEDVERGKICFLCMKTR